MPPSSKLIAIFSAVFWFIYKYICLKPPLACSYHQKTYSNKRVLCGKLLTPKPRLNSSISTFNVAMPMSAMWRCATMAKCKLPCKYFLTSFSSVERLYQWGISTDYAQKQVPNNRSSRQNCCAKPIVRCMKKGNCLVFSYHKMRNSAKPSRRSNSVVTGRLRIACSFLLMSPKTIVLISI